MQIAEGSVVMAVDKFFREQVKKINRKSKSVEKEYGLLMGLNEGMDNPLEIPQIDPPQNPEENNPEDLDPPIQTCIPGTSWIDSTTCERMICSEDGDPLHTGIFDKACLDAKNNPPNDPVDPNPPVNQPVDCVTLTNAWQGYNGTYYIGVDYFSKQSLATPNVSIDPYVAFEIASNRRFYFTDFNTFTAYDMVSHDRTGVLCGDPYPVVVSVPFQRNSLEKISIHTEQGENIMRERFSTENLVEQLKYSNDYRDYMSKISVPFKGQEASDPFALFDLPFYGSEPV